MILRPQRNWHEYTTIGQGFLFAKSNTVSKFLVESFNHNCVERTKKNVTEDIGWCHFTALVYLKSKNIIYIYDPFHYQRR